MILSSQICQKAPHVNCWKIPLLFVLHSGDDFGEEEGEVGADIDDVSELAG